MMSTRCDLEQPMWPSSAHGLSLVQDRTHHWAPVRLTQEHRLAVHKTCGQSLAVLLCLPPSETGPV